MMYRRAGRVLARRTIRPRTIAVHRTFLASSANLPPNVKQVGEPETLDWRLFFEKQGSKQSWWHSIPLENNKKQQLYNYVNEIPRGTRAKNEICTKSEHNPIKQDVKKGNLRFFKYGDIPFNYGALPQTFESPDDVHPDTKLPGDSDPLDVVEISEEPLQIGEVSPIKILGLYGLIDEGETDWKIIGVNKKSKLFNQLNDINDVDQKTLDKILDWFRNYKVPDGKPQNEFSHNEVPQPKEYATKVVDECHEVWKQLRAGKICKDKGLAI